MTRNILLTAAAIFIICLLGFWGYLLFFGSPQSADQIFVDLGFKDPTTERPQLITDINKSNSDKLVINSQLSQLTVRPVAGYVVTNRPTNRVRYAERGTGHIYEINFTTNIETRILGNTVAKTTEAYFSPDGLLAVLVSESDSGSDALLTTVPETTGDSPVTTNLPKNIREINVMSSTTINYLMIEDGKSVAYRFNRLTGTASELWRIPLTEIEVWWEGNKTYVVNKTAPHLKGAVYAVVGSGQLVPLTRPGFSYVALATGNSNTILETSYKTEESVIGSSIFNTTNDTNASISTLVVPEKCAVNPNNFNDLWCGAMAPTEDNRYRDFIKDWYMGTVSSDDYLWNTNLANQKTKSPISLKDVSGLMIDVIDPKFNQDGSRLFFLNKIDSTLWLYQLEAPKTSENVESGNAVPLNP